MKIFRAPVVASFARRIDIFSSFAALRMRTRLLLTLLAMGVLLTISMPSLVGAQDNGAFYDPNALPVAPPDPAPGTPAKLNEQAQISPQTMNAVLGAVISTITKAFDSLKNNDGIKGAGKTLAYSLFAIVFAWSLLKAMVQGDGINGIVAELVPLVATLAVITALLEGGGVGQIVKFMDSVASSFGLSGGLKDDIQNAGQKGFLAIMNILTMPSPNSNITLGITDIMKGIGLAGLFIVGLIAKIIASFIVVLAIAIYMANVVLAHGSIMLAESLAPLMVPFLLVPALSFIFDGWLKFTLGAAMIKVVGAFMIAFTSTLMDGLALLSQKVQVPPDTDFASLAATNLIIYCGLVLLAFLCAYMMMQVPQLASGLLSGSAGGAGFRGMRALTGGVGAQVGSAAGGAAASTAGRAAGRVAMDGVVNPARGAMGAMASKMGGSGAGLRHSSDASQSGKTPQEKYGRSGGAVYEALGGRMVAPKAGSQGFFRP